MTEEWRVIGIFPGCTVYEVSDTGRVRNAKTGRVLRLYKDRDGYLRAHLQVFKQSRYVYSHRMVCEAFVAPRPPSMMVDHIDGNRLNNVPSNLRWVTRSMNAQNRRSVHVKTRAGLLGVSPCKGGMFMAKIKKGSVSYHLGTFATAQAAHEAYVAAKRTIHEGCTL